MKLSLAVSYGCMATPKFVQKGDDVRVNTDTIPIFVENIMQRNPVFLEAVSYYLPEP
ncbi:hypothetical protein JCM37173_25920 [Allocoprococcus similis]